MIISMKMFVTFFISTLAPLSAAAQMILPGQWTSVVPESAMGFSAAFYMSPGPEEFSAEFDCLGRGKGLIATVDSSSSILEFPDDGSVNPRYLKVEGQTYRLPLRDENMYVPLWPGQEEMLRALYGGAEGIALIAPDNDLTRAVEIGRIPAIVRPPGLAHVATDCGNLPAVEGPVETIDPFDRGPMSGAWSLEDRSENIAAPVAINLFQGSGALTLFCDGSGTPAAAGFGFNAGPDRDFSREFAARVFVDDHRFDFVASHLVNGMWIFQVSKSLLAAMQSGRSIHDGRPAPDTSIGDLSGISGATSHAYGSCGPARDF